MASLATRCDHCGFIIDPGSQYIIHNNRKLHESCFTCHECKNRLGLASFYNQDNHKYCESCYQNKFGTRCEKCKLIITSIGVSFKDAGGTWHPECFTCARCNTRLGHLFYKSKDLKPHCHDCIVLLTAKICTACNKPITDAERLSFEDYDWHKNCFLCSSCNTSLVGHGFIPDGNDILCSGCATQKLIQTAPNQVQSLTWSIMSESSKTCEVEKSAAEDEAPKQQENVKKGTEPNPVQFKKSNTTMAKISKGPLKAISSFMKLF